MSSVIVMALKDLLLLWRDKFGLFWVLVFPLLFAVFFGSIFSGGGGGSRSAIEVALVDQDSTVRSIAFTGSLAELEGLDLTPADEATATERVRKGSVTAYLIVEEGFGSYYGLFMGQKPPIRIGVDPSRKAEAGYLQGMITRTLYDNFQKEMMDSDVLSNDFDEIRSGIATDSSMNDSQKTSLVDLLSAASNYFTTTKSSDSGSTEPSMGGVTDIEIEDVERERRKGPQSPYDISFPQAIIWGLIGCAASFAISIVTERTSGTLMRLRLAPISRVHILAGKAVACFVACTVVMILLLAFGGLVFGVNVSQVSHLTLAVFASSWCFVGIMMLMSVLGRSERGVAGAGWAAFMVMAMLGGGMVPTMFMPSWMKTASQISPVKWSIYSMEGAIWREFSMAEMMSPISVLFLIGLGCFILGSVISSRRAD